jgi:ribosome-binding protein aMBF1 (putative translation factor)
MLNRPEIDRSYADFIVRGRHERDWSQNDLALAAGLTETSVHRYETLRRPVPAEARRAIEAAFAEHAAKQEAVLR